MNVALDIAASARAGEPLESLEPDAQGAAAPMWTVSGAAWRFLWQSRSRGLQGGRARRSPEAAELRDAGLMSAFGGPTAPAEALLRALSAPASTLIATVAGPDGTHAWRCWFGSDAALIDEGAEHDGRDHGLSLVPAPTALARLLEFLGVAPAWSFEDGPVVLENAVLAARVASPSAPAPAGATEALRDAWADPGDWRQVLVADQDSRGVLALRTGRGWWRRAVDGDGRTTLTALPSAALVGDVLALGPYRAHG